MKPQAILLWMAIAIALVAALAFWDEERESTASLDDFAHEQNALAVALAAGMEQAIVARGVAAPEPEHLLVAARAIEKPGALRVLLATSAELVAPDGARVRSSALDPSAMHRAHGGTLRLSRPEAAELGLPARTAMAGLASVRVSGEAWTVIVVATAQSERDRGLRARWRLVLGVSLAAGLVLTFGGLAMRKQRKELELAHQLAMSTLRSERDERLVRADKLATMGALASGVAHEVSTPLGVILGRAEQLLPKQTDERSRRAVETIAAQTERIHAVIRGFLALARGKEPQLERRDPQALARAAVELVEHRFQSANVKLTTEYAPSLPKIPCEPRLFEQVLVNLLLNACDACEGRGGRGEQGEAGNVTLTVRSKDGGVVFEVVDDGPGVDDEVAARFAEPFFTTKPEGKGSGLGLAIAREIVGHHRGALTLQPRTDAVGTRASVEIPATTGASPAVVADDARAEERADA